MRDILAGEFDVSLTGMASQNCIFCHSRAADTVDHTPAKLFLPKPYPPDLVAVPACTPCNKSFQLDDEYFRAMLASRVGVDGNPMGRKVLDRTLRGLSRPEAGGLKASIAASAGLHPVHGPDGSILGHAPGFTIDNARVVRSLEHTVRGLYFHLTETPMPSRIQFSANLDLNSDAEGIDEMRRIIAGRPVFALGDAFRCVFVETAEFQYFTAWVIEFYGTEQFAVFSVDPHNSPERPGAAG